MNMNLEQLISHQVRQLQKTPPITDIPRERVVFFGNPHDSVPRRLLLEPHLIARDKCAYQRIKIYSQENHGTFPDYNQLQVMLGELGQLASRRTVSETLTRLRLTRWLSLNYCARDKKGRFLGNIYLLHDEPLSYSDAIKLDKDYLGLLAGSLKSSSKLLSNAAKLVQLALLALPEHIKKQSNIALFIERYQFTQNSKTELGQLSKKSPSSNMKLGQKHLKTPKNTES